MSRKQVKSVKSGGKGKSTLFLLIESSASKNNFNLESLMTRSSLSLILVAILLAAIPIFALANEANQLTNHPQVVILTDEEWESYNSGAAGQGSLDNVVAFYNYSPDTIPTTIMSTIYPLDLGVYSDLVRATVDWDFYVTGSLADQCQSQYAALWCSLVDSNYNWITPNFGFEYIEPGLAKATCFELPMAYILGTNQPNILRLQVYISSSVTTTCEGQFYLVIGDIRMRPSTPYVWPGDTLWGSYVEVTPQEAYVEITQCPISGQPHSPGDINVQVEAWTYSSNVPAEIQQFDLEISSDDTTNMYNVFCANSIKNIRIQCPGFGSIPLDISDFSWIPSLGVAWVQVTDYVTLPAYSNVFFEIICDFDSSMSPGDYFFTLGNSAGTGYCFGPSSIKNLNNNQFIWNITPATPITWGPTVIFGSGNLRIGLASNPGWITAVNGAQDVTLVEFAVTAENSDMTITSVELYGYIQGSPNSDSLYICRDYVDPPGTYVYVNNIVQNLRIYDHTNDPGHTTNLNNTAENFSSSTGCASFHNMTWIIPAGETWILSLVGDISNSAYYSGVEGQKWIKADFLNNAAITAFDQCWNQVLMTDVNGGLWEHGIDGNGDEVRAQENTTAAIIQITECGILNVTAESNPPIANVVAGTSDNPMLNLKFQAINEAFEVTKLQIFQADSVVYNRSVESVTISYQNQSGQTVNASQVLITGDANFNITSNPLYVPVNNYRIVNVYFNLTSINQTYGAYTGDLVKAGFPGSPQANVFEARGLSSGQILTQTSNGIDVIGNQMIVHGNFPTITPVTYGPALAPGPAELYKWSVTAAEGGIDVALGQITFKLQLFDSVPNSSVLYLQNFQIYEGSSYANATPLVQGLSGANSYRVWDENGGNLSSPSGYLYADTTGSPWTHTITVTFYDDRLIGAGNTKYYILRANAGNVDTGAGSNDAVSTYMYDGDTGYLPPLAADFNPETPNVWGAILDNDPTYLFGEEFVARMIWSDATGTYGNYTHTQSTYSGGPSSLDWFNGYKIKTLGVVRTLNGGSDDSDRSPNSKSGQNSIGQIPTEYSVANFPNPFNPETTISFSLPEASNINLTVYDVTGRMVAQLADGYFAAGVHTVTFNGQDLGSGIYFYSIKSGDFIATQKMMLMK